MERRSLQTSILIRGWTLGLLLLVSYLLCVGFGLLASERFLCTRPGRQEAS